MAGVATAARKASAGAAAARRWIACRRGGWRNALDDCVFKRACMRGGWRNALHECVVKRAVRAR